MLVLRGLYRICLLRCLMAMMMRKVCVCLCGFALGG